METNGVYFGAEIVRDLTPAPGSRMEKRRQRGREGGVGEGREREPSSLAPTLLLSLTYTSLCPSLSICLCLLPPLAVNLHPHAPHVYLFSSGQGYRIPLFWDPGSLLAGSGSRESWGNGDCDFQRPGRGGGRCWRGANLWAESELNAAPAPPPPIAWGSFYLGPCSAVSPQTRTPWICHLCQPWEKSRWSGLGPLDPA